MNKCIVCGSRFGQFYLEALKSMPNIKVEGLLASGSQRSIDCAKHYQIELYRKVDELPDGIDFACVAIKSEVQGGEGNLIAEALLRKGIDVIFEQPLSEREFSSLFTLARKEKRYFSVCNLYRHLPSVQNVIDNYKLIKKEQQVKYINVEFATQLSFPVAQLLSILIPESKNIEFTKSKKEEGPYQFLSVVIKDIQLNLTAYNEVVDKDIDSFMRLFFSIKIGFEGGELNLADPHGFVYWREYVQFPNRFRIPSSFIHNPPDGMTRKYIDFVHHNSVLTQQSIFTELWPCIITEEINLYLEKEKYTKSYFNTLAQNQINSAIIWRKIMRSFGYPKLIPRDIYELYDVNQLVRNDEKLANINDQMNRLENICAKSMLWVLSYHLGKENTIHTYQSIIKNLNVQEKYHNIIKRWLKYLSKNNYVIETEDGSYIFDQQNIHQLEIIHAWNNLEIKWNINVMPISIIQYFKAHFQNINKILSGEVSVNLLLFNQGENNIAKDLYENTAISRFINEHIAQYIERLSKKYSLSILELGAGTGATTQKILDKVKKTFNGEYVFTDLSNYFLMSAKETFKNNQFMQYSILDIDNIEKNKFIKSRQFDVIIAVGVINNSKNIKCLLKKLTNKLNPNGKLIIGEAYGESAAMLISQAFMMKEPEDERKHDNITFLSLKSWYKLFYETGFKVLHKSPYQTNELSSFNQALFILEKR